VVRGIKRLVKYILKRLIGAIIVLFGITLVTFILINVIPGDPALLILGQRADPETVARIHHEWGLDRPLYVQYGSFLLNVFRLDFGTSYFTRQNVLAVILKAFLVTSKVAGISFLISITVGIAIGIIAAIYHGKWQDTTLMAVVISFISAPSFWIAIILQIIFGLWLGWLPIMGINSALSYILPCTALGLRFAAGTARFTRTAMLDVLDQEYIKTARAKGQKEFFVIIVHALKNALIPVITLTGVQLGALLTGSILIETVFGIPGIGRLTVDSMLMRDLPMLQGCVLYIAAIFVFINFAVDILYSVIDPRIRLLPKGRQK
jgi:peptide/nickel transport system permease protein